MTMIAKNYPPIDLERMTGKPKNNRHIKIFAEICNEENDILGIFSVTEPYNSNDMDTYSKAAGDVTAQMIEKLTRYAKNEVNYGNCY